MSAEEIIEHYLQLHVTPELAVAAIQDAAVRLRECGMPAGAREYDTAAAELENR